MMSKLTLVIGNKNYSSWSLRPWIFMKYANLPFTEKRIPLFQETTNAELAPYFSNHKVPVLVDDDLVIWDSLAIMDYISDQYLDANGWPSDVKAKALARSISAEMHSSFFNLRNELPMNCRKRFINFELSEGVKDDIQRIKNIWRKCKTEYGADGEWLFGKFSIADAMFAPIAIRFNGYHVPLNELENAYVQSILTLPDVINWIESGKQEKEVIEMDEI